ncbi:hypothetical protein CEE37_08380 [candidate division LCP-89 bacterium B3_LCP]|uniref:Uncharacterized protein n=1 Tax=candidate division LCP-89 bacterium B3_LCP TaxID=2012998 RepID=A0A532UZE4_UNCL8|nr:MAG: hypothetical protein CEE37_08380 [candidate division LCP-89 bacterium B3_LCP]
MPNERLIITTIALLLALGTSRYLRSAGIAGWKLLGTSTVLLTGSLLLYYGFYIFDPSHGIGIAILPLATWWLNWRRDKTGKPDITTNKFILLQVIFCLLYIVVAYWQEA